MNKLKIIDIFKFIIIIMNHFIKSLTLCKRDFILFFSSLNFIISLSYDSFCLFSPVISSFNLMESSLCFYITPSYSVIFLYNFSLSFYCLLLLFFSFDYVLRLIVDWFYEIVVNF